MPPDAMLAIWSDVASDRETDYLHWLTREHTSERVSTSGFLGVRVFRAAREDVSRYFICYELASLDVIDSPAYIAKLNDPTPWSQRIMPLLGNFRRGGGAVRARAGTGKGSIVAPLILERNCAPDSRGIAEIACRDLICAVTVLDIDQARTSVKTREKSMRKQDATFAGLILLEGLNENAVARACADLRSSNPDLALPDAPDIYRQIFLLDRTIVAREERPAKGVSPAGSATRPSCS